MAGSWPWWTQRDSIAGYYTLVHSLSPAAVRRIVRRAGGKS